MIRMNTVNPPGDEMQVARFLDSALTAAASRRTSSSAGATDSARLRNWGMQALGLLPFPMDQDDEDRMHGNDERVPVASLEFGTKLIYGAILRVAQ
jgi:acetylornithine deacetylase/succinyl-diaminopimelate desuccinylase-like protein